MILLTFGLLSLGSDLLYHHMVSAAAGGLSLRQAGADLVNNLLAVVRVGLCWVRFLFYDLQTEYMDFTAHFTPAAEAGAGSL